jgi:hypothetical protein
MKDKEKLKIAVCFFGHLRSYQKCAPFLRRNLLKYYDCDLFMHTWSKLDHDTQTWHKLKRMDGLVRREDITNTYGQLKGIEIEEQNPKDLGNIKIKTRNAKKDNMQMSIFGMGAMFHSMRESLRQCEEYAVKNKVKYDYILFIRPDIWLKKPLKIQKILDELSEREIACGFFTFAHSVSKITAGLEDMGGLDLCFFATPKTMSDIIKNNALAIKDFKPGMLIDFCPEYSFIQLIKARGFTPYRIERFNQPKDWEIKRVTEAIKWRRRIIKLRICGNYILLWLFPTIMNRVINTQLDLFGIFKIDLAIGNPGRDVNDI